MKTIKLSVEKRKDLGKKATRELRQKGNVPCVMYAGPEVIHFHTHENDFRHLVYTPNVYLVELDIDGKAHKAVMQDIQFHPVTDKIVHIDFYEIFDDKPVIISVPIDLEGSAKGVKEGGKARLRRRSLKVRGLPKHLPDRLPVDISDVGIGEVIKVGDLTFDNLELLDPHRSMIYSVVSSRVALAGMTLDEPETEGEEGEEAEGEAAEGEEGAEEGAEGGEEGGESEE